MALDRTYRSIYLAGPTFNLLEDDAAAAAALRRIRAHLADGGSALIPLFVPELPASEELGRAHTHETDDGTVMRFTVLAVERDDAARNQVSHVRYELRSAEEDLVEERHWQLHWRTQADFTALVEESGLEATAVLNPQGWHQRSRPTPSSPSGSPLHLADDLPSSDRSHDHEPAGCGALLANG